MAYSIPSRSGRRVHRALRRLGCVEVAASRKHVKYEMTGGKRSTIGRHPQLPENTIRDFCSQVGIAWDAFLREY